MEKNLYWYRAVCDRVVDGDTISILVDLGMNITVKERVRILGIDTAEIYEVKKASEEYAKGMLSKARVEGLVLGQELYIKTHKDRSGKYGRLLCEVFIDDQSLGDLLVKEGHAVYRDY